MRTVAGLQWRLEGLVRWNEDRGRAAVEDAGRSTLRCYSAKLQQSFSQLTQEFMGMTLVENYTKLREYTGELIGVEYLLSQTSGEALEDLGRDPDSPDGMDEAAVDEWDEGFGEDPEEDPEELRLLEHHHQLLCQEQTLPQSGTSLPPVTSSLLPAAGPPSQSGPARTDDAPAMELEEQEEDDAVGPDGRGGYANVVRLARVLVDLRHPGAVVTQRVEKEIVALWTKLSDLDKAAVKFPPRHQSRLVHGRFKASGAASKRHPAVPGVDSVNRSVMTTGGGAAQCPSASRLVEAIVLELCQVHYEGWTLAGARVYRWGVILQDYNRITANLWSYKSLRETAPIQLYSFNHRTLNKWNLDRTLAMNRDTLSVAVPAATAELCAEDLPPAKRLLTEPAQPEQPLTFSVPEDTSGLAVSHRGPLAPALYDVIVPPVDAPAAAVVAATTITTTTSTATTSTATATAPPASNTLAVPRSTAYQRKKREMEQQRAQELGALLKPPRQFKKFDCKHCGQPKRKEFGHSRFKGEFYCPKAPPGGLSKEQWLEMKKAAAAKKD